MPAAAAAMNRASAAEKGLYVPDTNLIYLRSFDDRKSLLAIKICMTRLLGSYSIFVYRMIS